MLGVVVVAWLAAPPVAPATLYSSVAIGAVIVTPVRPACATLPGLLAGDALTITPLPMQFAVLPAPPVATVESHSAVGYAH